MSDIIILRAALDALNQGEGQTSETRPSARSGEGWRELRGPSGMTGASDLAARSSLVPELVQDRTMPAAGPGERDICFDDALDSESVRLLALKAQQQLSIQALAIANVRALSIIGLFRDDDPPIRLM